MSIKKWFFLVLFFGLYPIESIQGEESHEKKDFHSSHFILEHIRDAHSWHLWGEDHKALSIPLFIILWDEGPVFFISSSFGHGEKIVQKKNHFYRLFKGKIYRVNKKGDLEKDALGAILNKKPLDLSFSKNVLGFFLLAFFLIGLLIKVKKSYKQGYSNWYVGQLIEPLIIFIRDKVAIPYLGEKSYVAFLPFLLSVFFFILTGNLMGLLPGAPNVTGNISTSLVLAGFSFFLIIIKAKKAYWKHMFLAPKLPYFVRVFLIPIEIASFIIKPITLSIRLFANITAGHIIILSFIGLIFIFKSIFISGISIPFAFFISILEILVAFLQAFIFTTLSALFIGKAIKESK